MPTRDANPVVDIRDDSVIPPLNRKDLFLIGVAMALALATRLFVAFADPVLVRDGVGYLRVARAFAEGDIHAALSDRRDPAYPLLVSLPGLISGDFEAAGELVAVLMAALAVLPLYLLARRLSPPPAPAIAVFLYAVHPGLVEHSSRVLPESMLAFGYLCALCLVARGLARRHQADVWWGCLVCAVSYFVKPEALLLCALLLVVATIYVASVPRSASPRLPGGKHGKRACTALVVLLAAIAAYVLWLEANNAHEGRGFRVSSKIFLGDQLTERLLNNGPHNFYRTVRNLPGDFGFWLVPFLAMGLCRSRNSAQRAASRSLGWVVVMYLAASGLYRYSPRHEAQMFPLLLVWTADGAALVAHLVARGRASSRLRPVVLGIVAFATCGTGLVLALKPRHLDNLHIVAAGASIRNGFPSVGKLMSDDCRYAYYAEKEYVKLPETKTVRELSASLNKEKPGLFVVQDEDLIDFGLTTEEELLDGALVLEAVVGDRWCAFIYSVHPDVTPPTVTITGPERQAVEGAPVVIRYAASEPVAEYRTRLLPLEEKFTHTQETEAAYRGLPPGGYELQVVAVDLAGNRTVPPARYPFRVKRRPASGRSRNP